MNNHVLDPGTYFICDPCYVMSKTDYNRTIVNAPNTDFISNFFMAVHHVSGGDITNIEDNEGKEYTTDSGMFGVISTDLKDPEHNTEHIKKIKCKNPIQVNIDEFGMKLIDTVTHKSLLIVNFNNEEDEEEFDDENEICYDYDENDFESNQDCSEHRPSWY